MRRLLALLLPAVLAALALTCGDSTGPGPRLHLAAEDSVLLVGAATPVRVWLTGSGGDTLPLDPVAWESRDTLVATVRDGVVTGRAPGKAVVVATAGASRASLRLTVRSGVALRVRVTPGFDSLRVGATRALRADVVDSSGKVISGYRVAWASLDTLRGVVSADGVATGRRLGTFTVAASLAGVAGAVGVADLAVQAPLRRLDLVGDSVVRLGDTLRVSVVAADSAGNPLWGRGLAVYTLDPTVLYVAAPGRLVGLKPGRTAVVAASEAIADTMWVTVAPRPPVSVGVFLDPPRQPMDFPVWLGVGDTLRVKPGGYDALFQAADVSVHRWSTTDTTVLRVSADGLLTGVAPGDARVVLEVDTLRGSMPLRVEPGAASMAFPSDSSALAVGRTVALLPVFRDAQGASLTPRATTYASSDTAVVSLAGWTPAAVTPGVTWVAVAKAPGRAVITATSGALLDTFVVNVGERTPVFTIGTPGVSMGLGDGCCVVVESTAPAGSTARTLVTLRSSDTSVFAVKRDTMTVGPYLAGGPQAVSVSLVGRRAGQAVLVAADGVDVRTVAIVVGPGAVPKGVLLSGVPSTLDVGATARLSATALIGFASPVYNYPARWSTSDTTVATVSGGGVVTARAGGVVRVVARAEIVADSATIVVREAAAPAVTEIAPAEITPGATITISGTGFDPSAAGNAVTVDGVRASVTAASETQLTVLLPPAASFRCAASRMVPVVVSTAPSLLTARRHRLTVAPRPSATLGEWTELGSADGRLCFEVPEAGGGYLLVASNADTTRGARRALRIAFDTGASRGAAAQAALLAQAAVAGGEVPKGLDSLRRRADLHRRRLEGNRAIARRLGSPLQVLARAAARRQAGVALATDRPPAVPEAPVLGAEVLMRVPRLDTPDICEDYRTVRARVVWVGARSVVLEDTRAPLARTMDSAFAAVGREFDERTYGVVRDAFGDPLALDAQLDRNGRLAMLFTPEVNDVPGLAGFVTACDFFPTDVAPSSNVGEVFYALVPTDAGAGFDGFTSASWLHQIRSVVAHETKHVASAAERLARGAGAFEETWLEEATAMVAAELWARSVSGGAWKQSAQYYPTLYCEIRPDMSSCGRRPHAMFDHFALLHDYLVHARDRSPLDPTTWSDATFYGSGWALVRWAMDQYATDETAFLRALAQEPSLTGAANLAARTGRPLDEMLLDFAATLAFSTLGSAPSSRAQQSFPSWNLRDVFGGMSGDFPDYFRSQPLGPVRVGCYLGTSDVAPRLAGGAFATVEFDTCAGWPSFFDLRAPDGSTPRSIRAGLIRIR